MARYVIGDIHGCATELSRLIEALPLIRGDRVIFLGDYIDRGPDSRAVISYLLKFRQQHDSIEPVFLKGNHEDMLLSFLGHSGQYGEMFLANGGKATLMSYGVEPENANLESAIAAIPSDHMAFFQGLENFYATDSFLCVHAGINPQKNLAQQNNEELFWIRNTFIYRAHTLPYTVLFGHTPQPAVFFDLPYKVGLDTGLVYGNMLTCLELDEKVLFQIGRGKRRINRTSAERKWSSSSAFIA
jgi:calcineurin-like phosphoesterase family protein